jgi:PAS domain S-box-containing protein
LDEWPPDRKLETQDRLIADLVCDLSCLLRLRPDGVFVRDWSNRDEFLGYPLDELNDSHAWVAMVHSDDRCLAQETLTKLHNPGDVVTELRLLSKTGEPHWIRMYLRAQLNPALGRVEYVHAALQDITAIKRSEAEKSALLEIARDIAASVEIGELLGRVQRRMAHVLPCDVVVTFRWDEGQAAFCAIANYGMPGEMLDDLAQLRVPRGTFGGRTQAGHHVVINDVHEQSWLTPDLCERFRIKSLIAVPLRVHGRHFGTLAAYHMKPKYRFDAAQVELCDAIGRQVAMALERAELHAAQEEQAAISGALARVAQELIAGLDQPRNSERFCRLVAEVLECDVVQTWLWQPTEQVYVPEAMYGYSAEEWEHLRTLRLPRPLLDQWIPGDRTDDISQLVLDEHSNASLRGGPLGFGISVLMHMRLHVGSELIGIQCAGYRTRREPFSPIQMRIARGIAQIASMALSHSRLMEELARVNRLKSDFVATMSHELRTPMNTLMGYTDLLAAGEFGPVTEEQRGVLTRMDQSARELLDLINATLDLSRIEARRVSIEVHDIAVPELLRELEVETRYQRQQRGLDFAWEITPESSQLRSDRVKLKVILKNLITNALKFTERGGVRINAVERDAGLEVSVYDTGIGIAPDILPIIFEPFRQGESAATRRYGGVGLGLYVVRRLLDLLNGSISVESELGRGSTFRVWVPSENA